MKSKQKILDLLLPALQATRQYHDLIGLEYEECGLVKVVFAGGSYKVNVEGDSGSAMIRDILYCLG